MQHGNWVDPIQRLLERVEVTQDGCWISGHAKDSLGYAAVWVDGKTHRAHRVMWESQHGPIDPDLVIDHLCRQPSCINPAHLEPVTQLLNVRRGDSCSDIDLMTQAINLYRSTELSQEQVGTRYGVDQATISRWNQRI